MEVSLQEAIEIHAKALKQRSGRHAPGKAREKAEQLMQAGDQEGHMVWMKVGEIAEVLVGESGRG